MNSAADRARLRPYWAGVSFGAWAAAMALAPGLPAKLALAAPAGLIPLVWWALLQPHPRLTPFFVAAPFPPPPPISFGASGPHPCLLFAALGILAGAVWLRDCRIDLSGPRAPLSALFAVMLASVAMAAFSSGLVAAAGSLARVLLFAISLYVYFY